MSNQDRAGSQKSEQDSGPKRNLSTLFFGLAVAAAIFIFLALFQRSFGPAPELGELTISPLPAVAADNFTLESLTGQTVSLSDLKGKVVFLNFWATWCGPCKVEMPLMERLHKELRQRGFVVVAVDLKEDDRVVRQFVHDLSLTFPVLLDRKGSVSEMYRIAQIPTTYLIDREGKLFGKVMGPRDWLNGRMHGLFDQLLKK